MSGWDSTSFAVGLSVGGICVFMFLFLLAWVQERDDRLTAAKPGRKTVGDALERKSQRWTE